MDTQDKASLDALIDKSLARYLAAAPGNLDRLWRLADAAADMVRSAGLHRIRIDGEWLTRDEIADRIKSLVPRDPA